MKILFDQGTPVPLRQHLAGHVVDTAFERGWSDLHNGELLDRAEAEGYQPLHHQPTRTCHTSRTWPLDAWLS